MIVRSTALTVTRATGTFTDDAEEQRPTVMGCNGLPLTNGQPAELEKYNWLVERGAARNYLGLGRCLNHARGDLFRNHANGHGLIQVLTGGKTRLITTAAGLAPIIADRVKMRVFKDYKLMSELPTAAHLNSMLHSEAFLGQFLPLDEVVTHPFYLDDFSIVKVGYTDAGPGQQVLYLGPEPEIADSTATIKQFLDMMDFATNADRANTVGAAITIMLRRLWPGQKPLIAVTATKSHSGKGTITEFIRGTVPKADILYQATDWPMQSNFQRQLRLNPQIGMVVFDNVRCDSAGGHANFIRSGFIESFITNDEIVLTAPGAGDPFHAENHFVVSINANEGRFSPDLLNRGLSIHLAPKGSVLDRESPLGNPKLEYLPQHRAQIEAELHGMIAKWKAAGCPLDEQVKHSMKPWARTVGGILKFNGFTEFLANSTTRKSADDPVREALAILGAAKPDKEFRPREWARFAGMLGLSKTLLPPNERETDKGRERSIGVVLKRHLDETFNAQTETKALRLKLEGGCKRWVNGKNPHVRYLFKVLEVTDLPTDDTTPPPAAESTGAERPKDGVASANGKEPSKMEQIVE